MQRGRLGPCFSWIPRPGAQGLPLTPSPSALHSCQTLSPPGPPAGGKGQNVPESCTDIPEATAAGHRPASCRSTPSTHPSPQPSLPPSADSHGHVPQCNDRPLKKRETGPHTHPRSCSGKQWVLQCVPRAESVGRRASPPKGAASNTKPPSSQWVVNPWSESQDTPPVS